MEARENPSSLLQRHQGVTPPWVPLFYDSPLSIHHGDGCLVTDDEGKAYLDFYSGISTNLLGYNLPEVREALIGQLNTGVVHTSTFYLIRAQVQMAERVARLSGMDDPMVFFTCSGTEAVETALLLTTEYRDSSQVISLRRSYHGRSFGALAVTGIRCWQGRGLSPLRVAFAPGGRRRGDRAGMDDAAYVRSTAEELEELIASSTPATTAAMLVEPVQGMGGAIPLAPGQLHAYQEILRRHDIPLIVDEIQTGWGRTGKYWGFQSHNVTPDMLVFAKGVGNGLTMGGVVGRREIMSALNVSSISSFGGNPLSMAAATATLDYIEEHSLPSHAERTGALLLEGLRRDLADVSWVYEVRGMGLLQAIEFAHPGSADPSSRMASAVQERCRRAGLLVGVGGAAGNCLRIMPPLIVSEEQARQGLDVITAAIRQSAADIASSVSNRGSSWGTTACMTAAPHSEVSDDTR
ncbi:aspartate aminotransferase family protein [Streptomyces cyaneofuscatus]|uniref:aspartate aminotransferase family protein n=1 Tax=Streptomyces cyaneofuscatus TaxID=66883 RepID=UPI0029536EF9|nr:aspartate aminotransferase family protein [Streptomyces cyaneofuscatus]WOP07029.1 aspartate aminotransferase family protein [Streptomyces cyaneofuscatus]